MLIEADIEEEVLNILHLLPQRKGVKRPPLKKETVVHSGTGFVVLNGKFILTALHVVENGKVTITEKGGRVQTAKIVRIDEKTDLALLEVENPVASPLLIAKSILPSEIVIQIGNPGPMRWVMTIGRYMSFDGTDNVFDITTYQGNSGSPLLNERGEVVGVTHKVLRDNSRITFGGTIDDINVFLSR